jgi:lysophospholipase L1-like esterase
MLSTWQKLLYSFLTSIGIWLITESLVSKLYSAELQAWSSPPPASKEGAPTLKGNPYLLFEFAPGVRHEQGVIVNINSLGLRGPEIEIPKPRITKRLITTGDSSVFGFGVEDKEVFSSIVDSRLGENVEAINGAIPGYSSYQSINLMKLRGLKTEPDLFVIANIWSDNNFDSFVDKDLLAVYTGFEESIWGKFQLLLQKSNIYRVADWKLRVKKQQQKIRTVSWQVGSSNHIGARRVEINDYAANLEILVSMALSTNAEVVFVMLANEDDLKSEGGDKAWTPYREVMEDTAKRVGAPVIKVVELFKASGLTKEQLFLDEMHPTTAGHKIIGDALADMLESYDWANGGSIMGKGNNGIRSAYEDPFIKGQTTSSNVTGTNNGSAVSISGTVKFNGYTSGAIQIDALTAQTRDVQVINMIKIQGPGSFAIPIGLSKKVSLRAYIDPEGDGPDADDQRIDLSETVIHVDQGINNNILIDLDKKTISLQ